MTNEDQYKIALNILARIGIGGDLIGEFAKATSRVGMIDAQKQMSQFMQPQNTPVLGTPQPLQGTIPPEAGQSTPVNPLGAEMAQNQPI